MAAGSPQVADWHAKDNKVRWRHYHPHLVVWSQQPISRFRFGETRAVKRVLVWLQKLGLHPHVGEAVLATVVGWRSEGVSRLAAALSFYALLSLVPLLVTFHALFGLLFDERTLSSGVDLQVANLLGEEQARALRDMLNHARAPSLASLQAIIGSLVTFITAGGVFIALKDSIDTIWRVPSMKPAGIIAWFKVYCAPLSMVLGFAFLLLISLLLDALLSAMATSLVTWHPALLAILVSGNLVIGWLMAALLFASIFRWLPAVTVAWRNVWLGAVITATLFVVGRLLIGIYLGRSDFTGRYGPAGAVVAVVVWIYYSSQILFTGVVFTREQARIHQQRGPPVRSAQTWLEEGGMIGAP